MSFRIGEVAVGQNFMHRLVRNGMECEIIGGLELRSNTNSYDDKVTKGLRYRVRWADGLISGQEPEYLRKKKPPQETSTWEAVQQLTNWNPQKVTHE